MKIAFLGSGSMGCSIGGVLAEGGSDVYFVDTSAEQVDALNRNGLTIVENQAERNVKVRATSDPATLQPMDLVVVLVKSFATATAMQSAKNLIGPDTLVMSLQNGLGNDDTIVAVMGEAKKHQVICGRTYVGGTLLGPGRVSSGVKGKFTMIGEMDGTLSDRVRRVADEFSKAGLETRVSDNIIGMMWDKLLVNVATGALCSVTGLSYGKLYEMPELATCAQAAVAEGIRVAKAHGVRLDTEDPAEVWRRASAGLPYDFKPSMMQGLERCLKTEIDFINGSVVRYGEAANIPTPVNRTLVACVKGLERGLGIE